MSARILIVEDESIVQLDLQHRIQQMGHSVVGSAASGEEAIAKAAELKPDLVLMDVRLEGPMDGVQAASQIRARREVPVLFLTAHAGNPGGHQNVPLHPRLAKPFRAAELESAITQALNNIPPGHFPKESPETA